MDNSFSKAIFEELKKLYEPLLFDVDEPTSLFAIFIGFGWDIEKILEGVTDPFINSISAVNNSFQVVKDLIDNPPGSIEELKEAFATVKEVVTAIKSINTELPEIPNLDWEELPTDILNGLSIYYLRRKPLFYKVLEIINIIQQEEQEYILNTNNDVIRIKNILPSLNFDGFQAFITSPIEVLRNKYFHHGFESTENVNRIAQSLFKDIGDVFYRLGFRPSFGVSNFDGYNLTDEEKLRLAGMLTVRREFLAFDEEEDFEIGTSLGLINTQDGGPGVFAVPFGKLNLDLLIEEWLLVLKAEGASNGFRLTKQGFSFMEGIDSGIFSATLRNYRVDDESFLSIGDNNSSLLSIDNLEFEGKLHLENNFHEYIISLLLSGILLKIKPSNPDGFLSKILPTDGIESTLDLKIGWSSLDGISFHGNGGLEILIPIHKKIGPIELEEFELGLSFTNTGIGTSAKFFFNGKFGPVNFVVGGLGIKSDIVFSNEGNLGVLDLQAPSFQFPKEIGLSVEAAVLKGGGFVEKEEDSYSGVLNLLLGTIEITAIAIINTRMPDGSKGFSMLVSISTLFLPPIQLSFGFTLSGVGGLVGINRTLEAEVLKSRIREGAVNAIMFPENPIENAPQIISNLQAVFPPAEGRFVVAPFVRIGYGTPNIVYADIGVILEFPFNGRIILIGSVGTQLPTPEEAVVKINVDVVGDLNFAEQYIDIRGSLRDSFIHEYPLKGDFVFLLRWGARSAFLLSIGGYHPDYNPPSGFPSLNRLQVDFSQGPDVKIYGAFYTAITSNTFQIGANVEIYVKKSPFTVDGKLGFDALLIFRPQFSFKIDIYLVATVKWKKKRLAGAKIDFTFSGPGPFNANGYAKLEFLDDWITGEVDFNYTWGPTNRVSYAPVDLLAELAERINENSSWGAVLPSLEDLGVALYQEDKESSSEDQVVIVHPAGTLEFRQNILPFNKFIETMGHAPVAEVLTFGISAIIIGEDEIVAEALEPVMGEYARSHFENMTNEEKLSTPDFEPFETGVQFGVQELRSFGDPEATPVSRYEQIVINSDALAQSRGASSQPSKGFAGIKKISERNGAIRKPTDRLRKLVEATSPDFSVPKRFALTDKTTVAPIDTNEYLTYSEAKEARSAIDGVSESALVITDNIQLALV